VLFYECFSKDESSYGCLTVDREGFDEQEDVALGTTNVDYSLPLYEEFQRLRSYRRTRFAIDPSGFGVTTEGSADYHEEKIDLPPSWLRGFMQLQAAMSVTTRRLRVSREGLYNVLAFLKKHRAAAVRVLFRFELVPGEPVQIVLEPWEARIKLHDIPAALRRPRRSAPGAVIACSPWRVCCRWPTGPTCSCWAPACRASGRCAWARCVSCSALSGWTANDWTSGGGALADLAPPAEPSEDLLGDIAAAFQDSADADLRAGPPANRRGVTLVAAG